MTILAWAGVYRHRRSLLVPRGIRLRLSRALVAGVLEPFLAAISVMSLLASLHSLESSRVRSGVLAPNPTCLFCPYADAVLLSFCLSLNLSSTSHCL